jgi:hypothetical protein
MQIEPHQLPSLNRRPPYLRLSRRTSRGGRPAPTYERGAGQSIRFRRFLCLAGSRLLRVAWIFGGFSSNAWQKKVCSIAVTVVSLTVAWFGVRWIEGDTEKTGHRERGGSAFRVFGALS